MCGDQGVWLFPPSCSLIPGRVLEDAFFSTREQENKQGKPKGTDRVSPQQPADLQGSGYHPQRQAPGNFQDIPYHPRPTFLFCQQVAVWFFAASRDHNPARKER